ncbi:MAG: MotE family protein [Syntrophales bacterium]
MKKALWILQILVVLALVVKLAAMGGALSSAGATGSERSILSQAGAQTEPGGALTPRDVLDDELQRERDLVTALDKQKSELDRREALVRAEEDKLLALKKEVLEKIAALGALEKRLEARLEAEKNQDVKRLKDLAKVYDATAPDKAGAMLEKLDTKTAAAITMYMKKDKAGAVLKHVNVDRAVQITKEVTGAAQAPAPQKDGSEK